MRLLDGINLYTHQKITSEFLRKRPRAFCTSDPGTGKTLSVLDAFVNTRGKLLVLAPLSILNPAWGNDIRKFTNASFTIAHGTPQKRAAAMRSNVDIVITNHDAVKWIAKDRSLLDGFTAICVDEFTAFKNRSSQRSKALKAITNIVPGLWMLSGTPNSNTILDIWFPAFLVDHGQRLGRQFFSFRSSVCKPVATGPGGQYTNWEDKEGIELDVADLLKDITVRFKFEDCIDIPENVTNTIELDMPPWVRTKYKQLQELAYLEGEEGVVTNINAGAQVKKLLQLLSGAVYDGEGNVLKVHSDRYELVMTLAEQREQCVIAFNWRHELEQLCAFADKYKFSYAIINGDVSRKDREEAVRAFQAGELKLIFAHPQAAGHGLTLTKGTTTIWASPTYNAEHYNQLNARIYRNGQKSKTETIRVAYKDSCEVEVYEKLTKKMGRMADLLQFMQQFRQRA